MLTSSSVVLDEYLRVSLLSHIKKPNGCFLYKGKGRTNELVQGQGICSAPEKQLSEMENSLGVLLTVAGNAI
jgi:hypothetical protein